MAHALVRRSASVSVAALLVGAAAFWAVTMQFKAMQMELQPDAETIYATVETPPPPPPPTPEPTRPNTVVTDIVIDVAPLTPTVSDTPPVLTDIPFASLPPGPVEITDPRWARTPRDLARYYPRRALERGMEGAVRLDCLVDVRGVLTCTVLEETPPNWGFGQAALRISRDYQMVPAMREGAPVEGRYRMRVPFAIN